jgi:DNA polymerase eta
VEVGMPCFYLKDRDYFINWTTEKASIDEAFYDFSQPVREIMLERYPHLAQVPPDAPNGMDSPLPPPPLISWNDQSTIIPITPPPSEAASAGPEGEHGHGEDTTATWHDVALSIGAELMSKIREDVHVKLGYTTSAVRWCF